MSNGQEKNESFTDIFVCSRLKEERERKRLSQSQVADALGVTSKTVWRWEKEIPIPSDKLGALRNLDFDVVYVLTGHRPSIAQKITDDINQARVTLQVLNSISEPVVDYGRVAEFTAKFTRLDEEAKQTVEMMINTLLTKR